MSTRSGALAARGGWTVVRSGWERVSVYVPIVLMGFIRENGRFPDGIAGQVDLHGQQTITQSSQPFP